MKKPILLSISYFAEIDEELLKKGNENLYHEKIAKNMFKDFPKEMEINDEVVATQKVKTIKLLDPEFANCVKCNGCDEWVTDSNKPNAMTGLPNGMYVDDTIYCPGCYSVHFHSKKD